MFVTRCFAMTAGLSVVAGLSACQPPPQATPIFGYGQPTFTGFVAKPPLPPPPGPLRPTEHTGATTPLSERQKSALFKRFDEWQSRHAGGASSDRVDWAHSAPAGSPGGKAGCCETTGAAGCCEPAP